MITTELIDSVAGILSDKNQLSPEIVQTLRARYPGTAFIYCSDNDIPSRLTPIRVGEGYALYGIGNTGHCATLTADTEAACGLAIAWVDE